MFKFLCFFSVAAFCIWHFPTVNGDCIQVPNICPNKNITFWLYKRSLNNNGSETNCYNNVKLELDNPSFIKELIPDESKLIKILIHGYTSNKDDFFNTAIREAFLQIKNTPYIISVDWSPITAKGCREESSQNTRVVGNCTAQLIDTLVNEVGVALQRIHVIGFSLGGQTTAFIRKNMKSGTLYRISALDPTLPFFDTDDTNERLDASDGSFVDVYHTAGGTRGQMRPCGHLDVYFNKGKQQPGCYEEDKSDGKDNSIDNSMVCSHHRSPLYYAESINNTDAFYGVRCSSSGNIWFSNCRDSSIRVGYFVPYKTQGIFKVKTNSAPPFAIKLND